MTRRGIDWTGQSLGVQPLFGDQVILEIASFTNPCKTIKPSIIDGEVVRIAQEIHPGWSRVYARSFPGSDQRRDPS